MERVKYFVSAPNSVKKVAEEFRKKLKKMTFSVFDFKKKLKHVKEVDKCEFVLVFCPIVSRTGTDIDAKLNEIERDFKDKSVLLIVLHHTFDPQCIVSDSSKFVSRVNIQTVDVLFHEDKGLLECNMNTKALKDAADWIKSEMKNNKKTKKTQQKIEEPTRREKNNQIKDPVKPMDIDSCENQL